MIVATTLILESCGKKFSGFRYAPTSELTLEEVDFKYFSTRTRFKYKNGRQKTKAIANIRIRKDSLIWFSLSNGIGIEGARGKMSADSLIIIDRVNKRVHRYSFESLSREFNFEFSFGFFQSVLIGDMPVALSKSDKIKKKNNNFIITQKSGDLMVENEIHFKTRRLKKLLAHTLENDNTLALNYNEFKLLKEKPFAFKALMTLTYFQEGKKKEAKIDIQHKSARIETKPLRFPFKIPARYKGR